MEISPAQPEHHWLHNKSTHSKILAFSLQGNSNQGKADSLELGFRKHCPTGGPPLPFLRSISSKTLSACPALNPWGSSPGIYRVNSSQRKALGSATPGTHHPCSSQLRAQADLSLNPLPPPIPWQLWESAAGCSITPPAGSPAPAPPVIENSCSL